LVVREGDGWEEESASGSREQVKESWDRAVWSGGQWYGRIG